MERKKRSFVGRVKRLIFVCWLGAGAGGMNRPGSRPGLSEDDVGVHVAGEAAPAGLEGHELERMIHEVLEQAGSEQQAENLETVRTRIAASIACHAAIKINTPLEPAKIDWLLAELAQTEHPTSCPHGRPIVLRYSLKDIQRAFQRI